MKKTILFFLLFLNPIIAFSLPADKIFRGHTSEVNAVAFSPGGKYLASGGSDGTIIVWDIKNDVVVSKFKLNDRIFKLNFSYNSRELCVGTIPEDYNPNILQPCIFVCNIFNNSIELNLNVIGKIPYFYVTRDGRTLITVSLVKPPDCADVDFGYDNRFSCFGLYFNKYDLESLNYDNVFMGNYAGWDMDYSYFFAVSDNEEKFALSSGKELFVYDVINKKMLRNFEYKNKMQIRSNIVFTKDGSYLCYAKVKYFSDVIGIIDTRKNEEINSFSGHNSDIISIAIHPGGKYIASGGADNKIIIWDFYSGKPIKFISGHSDDVNNVVFSGDGRYLASCSGDKTVRLWDLSSAFPEIENYALEYDVEKGIKNYIGEEKDVELRLIENTFLQPEGNETYLEYVKRTEAANAEKKLIEEKYNNKFNELRAQKQEELKKRKK